MATTGTNYSCKVAGDCNYDEGCINNACINPCNLSDCGLNTDCYPYYHRPVCVCKAGFMGDPFLGCYSQTLGKSTDVCLSLFLSLSQKTFFVFLSDSSFLSKVYTFHSA